MFQLWGLLSKGVFRVSVSGIHLCCDIFCRLTSQPTWYAYGFGSPSDFVTWKCPCLMSFDFILFWNGRGIILVDSFLNFLIGSMNLVTHFFSTDQFSPVVNNWTQYILSRATTVFAITWKFSLQYPFIYFFLLYCLKIIMAK